MCYSANNSILKFPVECPLLAQSRHELVHCTCPLLGGYRSFLLIKKILTMQHKNERIGGVDLDWRKDEADMTLMAG
jgi:hypothetical protein